MAEAETDLTGEVSRIELESRKWGVSLEQRSSHAKVILRLLVSINEDYKRRYGTPSTANAPHASRSSFGKKLMFEDSRFEGSHDVEMASA